MNQERKDFEVFSVEELNQYDPLAGQLIQWGATCCQRGWRSLVAAVLVLVGSLSACRPITPEPQPSPTPAVLEIPPTESPTPTEAVREREIKVYSVEGVGVVRLDLSEASPTPGATSEIIEETQTAGELSNWLEERLLHLLPPEINEVMRFSYIDPQVNTTTAIVLYQSLDGQPLLFGKAHLAKAGDESWYKEVWLWRVPSLSEENLVFSFDAGQLLAVRPQEEGRRVATARVENGQIVFEEVFGQLAYVFNPETGEWMEVGKGYEYEIIGQTEEGYLERVKTEVLGVPVEVTLLTRRGLQNRDQEPVNRLTLNLSAFPDAPQRLAQAVMYAHWHAWRGNWRSPERISAEEVPFEDFMARLRAGEDLSYEVHGFPDDGTPARRENVRLIRIDPSKPVRIEFVGGEQFNKWTNGIQFTVRATEEGSLVLQVWNISDNPVYWGGSLVGGLSVLSPLREEDRVGGRNVPFFGEISEVMRRKIYLGSGPDDWYSRTILTVGE